MAGLKEVKGPGLPRNYQYIRLTGACEGREGGKLGSNTEGVNEARWKGNARGSSLRVDALKHLRDDAH